MKVEPSGVVMLGECTIRTPVCQALRPAPITAVWASPGRIQIDVCRPCLEEMIRNGEWEIQGARVPQHFDIAVYDAVDTLQLVVEVKSRIPAAFDDETQWASQVHRNLVTHAAIPLSPFFLLVRFPESFYLWKHNPYENVLQSPDYKDTYSRLLLPYLGLDENPMVNDDERNQTIVAKWLKTIVKGTEQAKVPADEWLEESGLFAAIQKGKVIEQAPADLKSNGRPMAGMHR